MLRTPARIVFIALLGTLSSPAQLAQAQVQIVFDYSLDTNNFFSPQARRDALEMAGLLLASRMTDSLAAIVPGGVNTWSATISHPGTGVATSIPDLTIPSNQIRVYAGGRALGDPNALGLGGPGGFQAGGTQAFLDTVRARGQAGALPSDPSQRTDFGPWGGFITFETSTNWNFNIATGPSAGQSDFLSVAMHELGHLLGFGLAPSFTNLASPNNTFSGPVSTTLYGSNPPLTAGAGHWANGTQYLGQEAAMDPSLTTGTRKVFTELDYAGLQDMGWQVVPVPEPTAPLVVSLGVGSWVAWRRRRQ